MKIEYVIAYYTPSDLNTQQNITIEHFGSKHEADVFIRDLKKKNISYACSRSFKPEDGNSENRD